MAVQPASLASAQRQAARRAAAPRTTRPGTCRSWRASRRSASGPACTSGRPTPAGSCTASGRSSTTRSTRRSAATATDRRRSCTPTARSRSRDDGRGIPVDVEPKTGLSGVEVVFTKLHAGGKFGGGSYAASGGLHGVGASVVNALSARLDVEVDRDGQTYAMSFRRGEPGVFAGRRRRPAGRVHAVRRPVRAARRPGEVKRGVTGTRVRYWADRQIFLADADFSYDELVTRARQTSYLVPGLRDRAARRARACRARPASTARTRRSSSTRAGIGEFAEFLATDEPVTDVWRLQGSGHFTETVPVLDERGHMTPHGGRARGGRRRRAALGDRLRHRGPHASSTSSPRRRAAPTSPASSRACSRPCGSRSPTTRAGSRSTSRTTGSRRTTSSRG